MRCDHALQGVSYCFASDIRSLGFGTQNYWIFPFVIILLHLLSSSILDVIMHWNIVCLLEFQRDKSIKTSGRLLLSRQHVLNYFFDLLSVWNLVKRASKRKRPPIYQAGCCRRIEDQGKILSLITVCSSYLNLRLVQLWWRGFRD